LRRRLGQLLAAVPDLDDEEPGQGIEVLAAPVVPDVGALTLDDDRDGGAGAAGSLWFVGGVTGEVHPQVLARSIGVGRARACGARGSGGVVGSLSGGHLVPQL